MPTTCTAEDKSATVSHKTPRGHDLFTFSTHHSKSYSPTSRHAYLMAHSGTNTQEEKLLQTR